MAADWPYSPEATYDEYSVYSGGDYSTLSSFISTEAGDFTSGGENVVKVANCGDLADTLAEVSLNGATTDTTHYWYIRATGDHEGKWSSSVYRITGTLTNGGTQQLLLSDDHVRIEGIQCQLNVTGDSLANLSCIKSFDVAAGAYHQFDRCIFTTGTLSGSPAPTQLYGINFSDGDLTAVVRNSLGYDFDNTNDCAFYVQGTNNTHCYNNTAINSTIGYHGGGFTTVRAINCLYDSQDLSGADGFYQTGGWASGTGYNASDLASDAPGTGARNEQTFTFVAEGSDDFHLDSGDGGALGYGTDLSSETYPVTEDIDGQSRSNWDIGMDEVRSAALTGTITSATETNIVSGGKTIILTLTGDTWIPT